MLRSIKFTVPLFQQTKIRSFIPHVRCVNWSTKIKPLPILVRCENPVSEPLTEGQQIKLQNARVPKSADVVFVVEESKCNKKATFKLKSIISSIEGAIKRSGKFL